MDGLYICEKKVSRQSSLFLFLFLFFVCFTLELGGLDGGITDGQALA